MKRMKQTISLMLTLILTLILTITLIPGEAKAGSRIIQTDASGSHNAVLLDDGSLWMWGYNLRGQCGNTYDHITEAKKCFSDVKYVSLGDSFTAMIKSDDSLWMCGDNEYGQLGDGTTTRRVDPVKIMDDVANVSAGPDYTAIVKNDGTLWMCGRNDDGQFGNNTTTDSLDPVQIDLEKNTGVDLKVSSVSAGSRHTAFITDTGELYTCGHNNNGQLGIGSEQDWYTPQHVRIPRNILEQKYKKIKSVVCGGEHTVIITDDDDMYICGSCGAADSSVPEKILQHVKKACAAYGWSAFLQKDGTLWMMGDNIRGQLGNGSTTWSPKAFVLRSNVADVAIGGIHTIVFDEDNTYWGCGDNGGTCVIGNGNYDWRYYNLVQLKFNPLVESLDKVVLNSNSLTYNGKSQNVTVNSVYAGGAVVPKDAYTVTGTNGKNAGKYTVTVTAKEGSGYTGTASATFNIKKGATSFKTKASKTKIRLKNLNKRSQSITISAKKLSVGSLKPVYSVKSVSNNMKKYVSVSKSGKVTIKKGCKKCKIVIAVTSKSNNNRNALTKKVTIKVV